MEVARLELVHTETNVKFGDLLRTSGLGTNQHGSETHYLQALKDITRLKKRIFLVERHPCFITCAQIRLRCTWA